MGRWAGGEGWAAPRVLLLAAQALSPGSVSNSKTGSCARLALETQPGTVRLALVPGAAGWPGGGRWHPASHASHLRPEARRSGFDSQCHAGLAGPNDRGQVTGERQGGPCLPCPRETPAPLVGGRLPSGETSAGPPASVPGRRNSHVGTGTWDYQPKFLH